MSNPPLARASERAPAGTSGPERRAGRVLTQDLLFVGITRPAMRFGVTFSALLLNGVVTLNVFLFSGNLLVLVLFVPVHGICALLCARDARIFDLLWVWARTGFGGRGRNRGRWSCASYSPLVLDPVRARGRRRQVIMGTLAHAPSARPGAPR